MISASELLAWAETHKTLSKTYSPGADGKFYYAIPWVDLRGEIQRLTDIESEVIGNDKETTERQQEI